MICEIYGFKKGSPYYDLAWSFFMIYLGGMGLAAKMMFLKIPIRLDEKLHPYINTIVLLVGLCLLISSLFKIF